MSYSDQRAKKDQYNRKRGVARLRKQIATGRITKEQLNNRGYNKFLKLTGEVAVEIDEAKIAQATRWDGLKGYITNTELPAAEIIESYGQLWQIERAFRISKTDLRIRPMYHRRRRRIEAHVLVAFVAYMIYKELERRLTEKKILISPKRAAELTQTMYEMTFRYPDDPEDQRILLQMDPEQRQLYELIWYPESASGVPMLNSGKDKTSFEEVFLLSSHSAGEYSVDDILDDKRGYWGIENGLHQRLDCSAMEDKSKVRNFKAAWNLGMFRRLAVSLAVHWIRHQPDPRKATLTGFYDAMSADQARKAFALVTTARASWLP